MLQFTPGSGSKTLYTIVWIYPQLGSPTPPIALPSTQPQSTDPIWDTEDDVIPCSRKALREVLRNFSPSELPAYLAVCLADDKIAISAIHLTYRLWEQQSRASSTTAPAPPHLVTPDPASPDSQCSASIAPTPNPHASQLSFKSVPPLTTLGSDKQPVEPISTNRLDRDEITPLDLSLLVCQTTKTLDSMDTNRANWDPCFPFPELCTTSTQTGKSPLMTTRTTSTKMKAHLPIDQTHPLHRTTKEKNLQENQLSVKARKTKCSCLC